MYAFMPTIGKITGENLRASHTAKSYASNGLVSSLLVNMVKDAKGNTSVNIVMDGRSKSFILAFSKQDSAIMQIIVKNLTVRTIILKVTKISHFLNGLDFFQSRETLVLPQTFMFLYLRTFIQFISKRHLLEWQLKSNAI